LIEESFKVLAGFFTDYGPGSFRIYEDDSFYIPAPYKTTGLKFRYRI